MKEIFNKLKGTRTPVAVYYKSSGGFCAGFVRESDDEFVLMEFVSPSGHFDGFHCIRIEEILKIDVGSTYLKNLVKVYRHYADEVPQIRIAAKNVLESFIDFSLKSKKLCTMEVGFETIEKLSGYVSAREWNILEMRLLDEGGLEDGYTGLDLEEIVYFGWGSEYEKYLELLGRLNKSETSGEEKKGNSNQTVLSFPKGK